MIVLSVGMPRAGSGWHYNLIHDLMRTRGCVEATEVRRRFHLENVLTEVNCNIGVLSARRLALVAFPALLGNSFVIKAHSRPTLPFRLLKDIGLIRTTYIYRDPRDAMLSAMNYGQRARQSGRPNAFSELTSFAAAMDFMAVYVSVWEAWLREPGIMAVRYEDLLTDYEREARKLASFLGLDAERAEVAEVISRLRPERAEGRQGTHFFKGRVGRFREAFSSEQQQVLVDRFGPYLGKMGYSL